MPGSENLVSGVFQPGFAQDLGPVRGKRKESLGVARALQAGLHSRSHQAKSQKTHALKTSCQ